MQKEVARALGLINDDAVWLSPAERRARAKATAVRPRPGHTRRPYRAEDTAASGGEEQDSGDELADEEPQAKRLRPTNVADSLVAPGDNPVQAPCRLTCILDLASGCGKNLSIMSLQRHRSAGM